MLKILFLNSFLILFFSFSLLTNAQMFVSPSGDDNNPGTIEQPFKTISKAVSLAGPDSIIYLRGGVYQVSETIRLNKSGQPEKRIKLFAYPGEKPILDFSSQPFGSRGIQISHNYWHVKGLTIRSAGDNGIYISAWYTIVENCDISECKDTGLQIGGGGSYNQIINCDSYFNADPGQGNADGFAAKLDVGTDNYFYGCRAWQNSDDGWDGYLRGANNINTTVENSWCFANGYLKSGSPSNGNGNGYKMGGGDNGNNLRLSNNFTLINSIAFDNRVKGFDQNNNRGSMKLYNCSAYRNGTNYSIPSFINEDKTAEIINSVVLGQAGNIANHVVQQTNSWLGFTAAEEDFISIDTTGMRGPRKADGSLPDVDFLHLSKDSKLIDVGTDINLPFFGSAPDLGAFEYDPTVPVELVSFTANIDGGKVILNWITATEINNAGFEIQKEINKEFITVGFIAGAGNSTEVNSYSYTDEPQQFGNLRYRIKQIDFTGEFTFSEIAEVEFYQPVKFSLEQNYPNPFNPTTNIEYSIKEKSNVTLIVYNMIGEMVSELVNEVKSPGTYHVNFDAAVQGLSSGIYFYTLTQGENKISKKMIILK